MSALSNGAQLEFKLDPKIIPVSLKARTCILFVLKGACLVLQTLVCSQGILFSCKWQICRMRLG